MEASGTLIITDGGGPVAVANGMLTLVGVEPGAVVRVNPRPGARTIISDATTGSGPALVRPILHGAIAVEASGGVRGAGFRSSTGWPVFWCGWTR